MNFTNFPPVAINSVLFVCKNFKRNDILEYSDYLSDKFFGFLLQINEIVKEIISLSDYINGIKLIKVFKYDTLFNGSQNLQKKDCPQQGSAIDHFTPISTKKM